jgi:hypothetical protein
VTLSTAKYDDDEAYYVVNNADYDIGLNSTAGDPEIIQELRRATNDIIIRQAKMPGRFAVKIAAGLNQPRTTVKGYATFLHLIQGSSLAELEQQLGYKSGALQRNGAYVYLVDGLALNQNNIAPRGNTDWSAGVSPRDLDNLSKAAGKEIGYHRDYPAASKPIIQFVILEPVPHVGIRFILPGGAV